MCIEKGERKKLKLKEGKFIPKTTKTIKLLVNMLVGERKISKC